MSEPKAIAYVNWGRWVAECPYGCGSAVQLQPGQGIAQCIDATLGGCGRAAAVVWPVNADAIGAALAKRPAAKHRNWFPRGHPTAVGGNMPHGQTVDELDAETAGKLGDDFVPPEEQQRRDLNRLLAEHGMRLAPDGTTLRRL